MKKNVTAPSLVAILLLLIPGVYSFHRIYFAPMYPRDPGYLHWIFTLAFSFSGWPLLILAAILTGAMVVQQLRGRAAVAPWWLAVLPLWVYSVTILCYPFSPAYRAPTALLENKAAEAGETQEAARSDKTGATEAGETQEVAKADESEEALDRGQIREAARTTSIRIIHANIYRYNQNQTLKELSQSLLDQGADILVLHELEDRHRSILEKAWQERYPHRFINTTHPYFGFGIYSRYPLQDRLQRFTRLEALASARVITCSRTEAPDRTRENPGARKTGEIPETRRNRENPGIDEVRPGGWEAGGPSGQGPGLRGFHLITSHPVAPFNPRILQVHFRALRNLKQEMDRLESSETPVVITGDFNSVDWSMDMQLLGRSYQMVRDREFRDVLFRGTFPASWPELFRLPIDGFLVSRNLRLRDFRRVHLPGSDHLGLMLEFQLEGLENCEEDRNLQRSSP